MPYFGSTPPENALEADDIASNAVTTAKIANDAVDIDKINLVSTSSAPSLEAKGTSGQTEGYIQLNCAENSHGIKLKSPPHSAGQSYTLTYPSAIVDGGFMKTDSSGNLSFAGAGKVLQVVQTTVTDTKSTSTQAPSFADVTDLTVNITPAATSSKVLVMAQCQFGNNAPSAYAHARLVRGSTAIHVGDSDSASRVEATASWSAINSTTQVNVPMIFLDSPSTTSETTYKVQFATQNSSHTLYLNRSSADSDDVGQGRSAPSITVMEIGA